jgi:hypothetical protein
MSDWVTLRDTLGLQLRPIDTWPGPLTMDRQPSPFSAPLKDTLGMLRKELRELRAKDIILQIALRPQDLRLDGLPRAGAIATHPGIILTFDSKHGPLSLSFDKFRRWEHNCRAIAMHLEHLRMAGLYGVGRSGEQYKGWKKLEAPKAEPHGFESSLEAALFLVEHGKYGPPEAILTNPVVRQKAYQNAARKLHPDAGGSHEDFIALQKAMEWFR